MVPLGTQKTVMLVYRHKHWEEKIRTKKSMTLILKTDIRAYEVNTLNTGAKAISAKGIRTLHCSWKSVDK